MVQINIACIYHIYGTYEYSIYGIYMTKSMVESMRGTLKCVSQGPLSVSVRAITRYIAVYIICMVHVYIACIYHVYGTYEYCI